MDRLKHWIRLDIDLTIQKEREFVRERKYAEAAQQADFGAALERVLTHIRTIERDEDEEG